MQQLSVPLVQKEVLKPGLWRLTVALPEAAESLRQIRPGQFVLVQCADLSVAYLRRPIFPAYVPLDVTQLSIDTPFGLQFIIAATDLVDNGLAWLLSRKIGDTIDLLGPLGQGFPLPHQVRNLLLLGSGPDLEVLFFQLNNTIRSALSVVLAIEAPRAADLYGLDSLPPEVELRIATSDGSLGHRGSILQHLDDLLHWADAVYVTGPLGFYQALQSHIRQTRLLLPSDFVYVLHRAPTLNLCGVGICTMCTVIAQDRMQLACQDGPVFDLAALDFADKGDL